MKKKLLIIFIDLLLFVTLSLFGVSLFLYNQLLILTVSAVVLAAVVDAYIRARYRYLNNR